MMSGRRRLVITQLVVKSDDFKDAVARTVGRDRADGAEGLVLLTSVAFAIGVIRLGRRQCLVQELPAIEGLARVRHVCLDKTGTLTEGGMDVTELRPLDGVDETYIRKVLGALGESDPRPNASLQAIIDAYPDSVDWRCVRVRCPSSSRPQVQRGRVSEGDGETSTWLLGAPDVLLGADDPALAETSGSTSRGCGCCCWPARAADLDDTEPARGAAPHRARSCWNSGCGPTRPTPCATSPRQDVRAKVISGDNAVSVGAVAGKLGLEGTAVDARRLPADPPAMAEALDAAPSSGGSPRSRSGTWSARSSRTGTRSR
ncbi:hypothetical protein GCM10017687_49530 [Streptomyces echinatus]